MKRGVVLIAHNTEHTDYYKMAVNATKLIHKHLHLPVSIITDKESFDPANNLFDHTFLSPPNKQNSRKRTEWFNKDRYLVFELSPYDETIALDTDYLVNSDNLLRLFDYGNDLMFHNTVYWPLVEQSTSEYLGKTLLTTYWATVMYFKKTHNNEKLFGMMEMIQQNYGHYSNIYGFDSNTYRNDYALTVALKTISGHIVSKNNFIPWNLVHCDTRIKVTKNEDVYTLTKTNNDGKSWYICVKNLDFHMLNKLNCLELFE